ncbi:MAG: TonB-dependent receptor plug domain-containing protein, partial [Gammaproteobacteria bacterium]|nr:TonB-dependent receptor plug domain-containing protein [Gammaproteobacteria bacterium]
MFRIPIVFLSILFIAICGRISLAQELVIAELTENDYFGDLPVVLTTTRLKQSKKNSPTATTIIDREMIEASGFTEIADLLRLAPGMLVNYDSGHIANAGYQFLYDRYRVRLQVLVDGMSVYTPLFGEMPWTQLGITIDDIDRIEVIRGPSSASYGPNAMTGVISIITKHAVLDSGISLKANQGSMGRSEQFLTMGDTSGNLDYKLSLAARKDDGFENRYDEKDLGVAYFRGDYQATDNDVVTFYFNYSSGDYQEDSTPTLNSSM